MPQDRRGGAAAGVVMCVVALGCGGDGDARPVPTPTPGGGCPKTLPGREASVARGFDVGNDSLAVTLWPRGTLVAGRLPGGGSYAEVRPDGSIVAKLAWLRLRAGTLRVEGRRLDADAPALRAVVPRGYGAVGVQPSSLVFPTPGCWEVTGRVGSGRLAFVTLVRRR